MRRVLGEERKTKTRHLVPLYQEQAWGRSVAGMLLEGVDREDVSDKCIAYSSPLALLKPNRAVCQMSFTEITCGQFSEPYYIKDILLGPSRSDLL